MQNMTTFTLPFFGELNHSNLNDYYDVEIDFGGYKLQIDLNFEHKVIDINRLVAVKDFLGQINNFDKINKERIKQDYLDESCDTVKTYVEYFIEDNDEEELLPFIAYEDKTLSIEQKLVNVFKLVRLGLYPDSIERFATFDYTVDRKLTDDLVVIFTDQLAKMDYMTLESWCFSKPQLTFGFAARLADEEVFWTWVRYQHLLVRRFIKMFLFKIMFSFINQAQWPGGRNTEASPAASRLR